MTWSPPLSEHLNDRNISLPPSRFRLFILIYWLLFGIVIVGMWTLLYDGIIPIDAVSLSSSGTPFQALYLAPFSHEIPQHLLTNVFTFFLLGVSLTIITALFRKLDSRFYLCPFIACILFVTILPFTFSTALLLVPNLELVDIVGFSGIVSAVLGMTIVILSYIIWKNFESLRFFIGTILVSVAVFFLLPLAEFRNAHAAVPNTAHQIGFLYGVLITWLIGAALMTKSKKRAYLYLAALLAALFLPIILFGITVLL
ncbi:rhomboid family intramembrane serine protease [uncultured Methanocorpusculum sp.]|nr:rhomboid family intramembrane serine protease [uncultured Methanocorpusculum sp.]